jgi:integrase
MATTAKGHIEQLPSGSYRVKVYAGKGPVTGKECRLRETCPDETSATIALGRLLKEAEGHVAPERDALFGRVLDAYLEVTELAATTRVTHESYIRRIIRPVLGEVKAARSAPTPWTPSTPPSSAACGCAAACRGPSTRPRA